MDNRCTLINTHLKTLSKIRAWLKTWVNQYHSWKYVENSCAICKLMDSIFPVKWAGSFSTQTFYCGQNLWHKIMPLGCDYFWREINISLSAFWQFYIHRFPSNCAHYWPPLQLQFSALQFKQLCIVIQPGERTSLTFPAFKLNSAVKNWEKSLIKSKPDQDVVRRKADTNQTAYLSKSCLTSYIL